MRKTILLLLLLGSGCDELPRIDLDAAADDACTACDDGGLPEDAALASDAAVEPGCGDGIVQPGEDCEPNVETWGCSDTCRFAATCEDPVLMRTVDDRASVADSLSIAQAAHAGSCGGAGGEHVIAYEAPAAGRLRVQLVAFAPAVLHVRRACADASTEIVCRDAETLRFEDDLGLVEAGETLYFLVDLAGELGPDDSGTFFLDARVVPVVAEGEACDPSGVRGAFCAPGQRCDGRLAPPLCEPGTAPRVLSATAFKPTEPFRRSTGAYDRVRVRLEVEDPDRDVLGFELLLRDADGALLYAHSGRWFYERALDGDRERLGIELIDPYLDRSALYMQVDVRVYDTGLMASEWTHLPITVPDPVARGGTCDMARWSAPCAETLVCDPTTLRCVDGIAPRLDRVQLTHEEGRASMPLRITDPDGPFVEAGFGADKRPYRLRFEYLDEAERPVAFDGDGDGTPELELTFPFVQRGRAPTWLLDPANVAGTGFRPDIAVERIEARGLPVRVVITDDSGLATSVILRETERPACALDAACDEPFERCPARWDWETRRCVADSPPTLLRVAYHRRPHDAVIGVEVRDADREWNFARAVLLDARGYPVRASLDGFFDETSEAWIPYGFERPGDGLGGQPVVPGATERVRGVALHLPEDPARVLRASLADLPRAAEGGACDGDPTSAIFGACAEGLACDEGACVTRGAMLARLCGVAPVLRPGEAVLTATGPSHFEPPEGCGVHPEPALGIAPAPGVGDALVRLEVTEPIARLRLDVRAADRSAAPIVSVQRGCGEAAELLVCRGALESDWGAVLILRDVAPGSYSLVIDETYGVPTELEIAARVEG